MIEANKLSNSPLSIEEIELIQSTSLSSIERHHLRIIAHCLECFRSMSNGKNYGPLPSYETRMQWCMDQPNVSNDPDFVALLLEQFSEAAKYLEEISLLYNFSPLQLTLKDLINASLNSSNSD